MGGEKINFWYNFFVSSHMKSKRDLTWHQSKMSRKDHEFTFSEKHLIRASAFFLEKMPNAQFAHISINLKLARKGGRWPCLKTCTNIYLPLFLGWLVRYSSIAQIAYIHVYADLLIHHYFEESLDGIFLHKCGQDSVQFCTVINKTKIHRLPNSHFSVHICGGFINNSPCRMTKYFITLFERKFILQICGKDSLVRWIH